MKLDHGTEVPLTLGQIKKLIQESYADFEPYHRVNGLDDSYLVSDHIDEILPLIKEFYAYWTGKKSNGKHVGLSSNPKAQKLSEKLYKLLGHSWVDFTNDIDEKLIDITERWFDRNPEFKKYRITAYGKGKAINETWPEIENLIEIEVENYF